jgi:hypothetical protein
MFPGSPSSSSTFSLLQSVSSCHHLCSLAIFQYLVIMFGRGAENRGGTTGVVWRRFPGDNSYWRRRYAIYFGLTVLVEFEVHRVPWLSIRSLGITWRRGGKCGLSCHNWYVCWLVITLRLRCSGVHVLEPHFVQYACWRRVHTAWILVHHSLIWDPHVGHVTVRSCIDLTHSCHLCGVKIRELINELNIGNKRTSTLPPIPHNQVEQYSRLNFPIQLRSC